MTTYIHGTSHDEQVRLNTLNALTNQSFMSYLGELSEKDIADFGCGTGVLMANIVRRFPTCCITGIELSPDQLRQAEMRLGDVEAATLKQCDVSSSGLADGAFDVVYCRYLLEHVIDPVAVAREMMRVTRPGGTVAVQENDLHNVLYYPEIEGMTEVLSQFCILQQQMGGDPFVGRKLFDIFKQAGAEQIELAYEPEIYTEHDPDPYRAWLYNATGIFRGAGQELLGQGMVDSVLFDDVLARMEERIHRPVGVALFHWNRARVTV
ncbi:MAG: methyltransferase domain-containing protein [Deltaproteobacteria bacterium]|nr:methyltransferase domain-containing protein [Candidatus Zymogenaceae bacterium]